MRSSTTSTFTGVSVSRIDIEPVATEACACAARVALRPSQPFGAPARRWPMPMSDGDFREVSFPESLRLRGSVTAQPSSGRWQLTQAVLLEADTLGSQNSRRPRSTSAWFSTGRGGGRR
jgi:hypothetical protein